jgi:hypothetical protein
MGAMIVESVASFRSQGNPNADYLPSSAAQIGRLPACGLSHYVALGAGSTGVRVCPASISPGGPGPIGPSYGGRGRWRVHGGLLVAGLPDAVWLKRRLPSGAAAGPCCVGDHPQHYGQQRRPSRDQGDLPAGDGADHGGVRGGPGAPAGRCARAVAAGASPAAQPRGGDVASWSRGRDDPRTRLARSWRTPAAASPAGAAARRRVWRMWPTASRRRLGGQACAGG